MYIHLERLQSLGYLSMLKSSFYLLSPFREECDYFLCYLGYFWQKAGRDHKLKNQNQNVTYPILLIRFQTKKLVYRFLIALFHFETHFVQCFTFFRIFWTVGEFVPSRNQEISLIKIEKFPFIELVSRVPSFYIRSKFRLKNHVAILHLLQC